MSTIMIFTFILLLRSHFCNRFCSRFSRSLYFCDKSKQGNISAESHFNFPDLLKSDNHTSHYNISFILVPRTFNTLKKDWNVFQLLMFWVILELLILFEIWNIIKPIVNFKLYLGRCTNGIYDSTRRCWKMGNYS